MNLESDQQRAPLYLLPKVDMSKPLSREILQRLNLYAGVFCSLQDNPNTKLSVAITDSSRAPVNNREYANLKIIVAGGKKITFFLGILRRSPDLRINPKTLIAGDPVYGFLSAVLMKIMKTHSSNIQIQFHGDTYSASTIHDFKSFFRFLITRISFKFANSIRVVSNFQIEELQPLARNDAILVTSPIPLDYKKIPTNPREKRAGIGFIGRLHRERGIKEFLSIILELRRRQVSDPIYVIGEGPEKSFLANELQKANLQDGVFFLGNLENEELCTQYSKLKVILSCAPSEGYGLTLREGALSGVQIVARNSSGSTAALRDFGPSIHLYASVQDAVNLVIRSLKVEDSPHSNRQQIISQKNRELDSISAWVSTW